MFIINLGLQCVGIMRKEMTPETEASIASCNNMAQLRKVGESKPDLVQAVQDSIEPVKILLTDIMHRLKLKDKPFSVFSAASESDMKELWLELEQIDQSLLFNGKHWKKDLLNFPQVVQVSEPLLSGAALLFHNQQMWCFIMFTMQTSANAKRSF